MNYLNQKIIFTISLFSLFLAILVAVGFLYIRKQAVKGISDASALVKDLQNQEFSYELNLGKSVPLDLNVSLDETFNVPVRTDVPIKTTINAPVTVPFLGQIVNLTVPIDITVPIDLTLKVPIKKSIPIKLDTPFLTAIPVKIQLKETSLGAALERLDALLTDLTSKLRFAIFPFPKDD